ncbi:MAG TPA: AraC family transcriptional regulator, partial [Polyangiaceae bacterium]|nr:AraC family transcriptional regulator [Polyangiaceae bacterium]
MELWRVSHSPGRGHTHTMPAGFGHPLLAPVVASYFEELRVSAALSDGNFWWRIHSEASVSAFELEHGAETERQKYNRRMFARAIKQRKVLRGEHAGYSDLFVPIVARGKTVAMLVTGPFSLSRPSAGEILARFRRLTGRQGHLADPEFDSYLAAALSTLVLDRGGAQNFERLTGYLGQLLAGEGDADELANRAEAIHLELAAVRSVEQMWDAVRTMVDDRFPRTWSSAFRLWNLRVLGLSRAPDQALLALGVSRRPASDPVDEVVRRDAFQREAVGLARATGELVAGRVGDQGVVFLSSAVGSARAKKQRLLEILEQASSLGRRFDLELSFGASVASPATRLSRKYQAALGAAQAALGQGAKVVFAESGASAPISPLRDLRRGLGQGLQERPEAAGARFEHYLEAVAAHCGYRLDPARGHLESGFERMAEPLIASGALDEKSFGELCQALDRAASAARTMTDLSAAYRQAVADLSQAVRQPVPARQGRSLRRAFDYIHQHYSEPLRIDAVARVAGFTPSYFSKLFIERERVPFARYVSGLRLERAKQLLTSTELDVVRVAQLVGFNSHAYFCRVFRRHLRMTPQNFRR